MVARVECFMLCLKALAILVGTTAVFGPLTYAVATLHWPWFDSQLAADRRGAVGLNAGAGAMDESPIRRSIS